MKIYGLLEPRPAMQIYFLIDGIDTHCQIVYIRPKFQDSTRVLFGNTS